MFILVNFGSNKNGLWSMKRYKFQTILDAVECGENTNAREGGTGFVVIASYYDDGKNDDEMKVVYEENAEDVEIQTFPHISVRSKCVTV